MVQKLLLVWLAGFTKSIRNLGAFAAAVRHGVAVDPAAWCLWSSDGHFGQVDQNRDPPKSCPKIRTQE